MRKFRIVKRGELWHFSRPGCPAGWHFCGALFNFFSPDECGSVKTWQLALDKVITRQKWDELERHRLMAEVLKVNR